MMRSLLGFGICILIGLLAAGLVLLVATQPRGEAIRLIPPPTESPLTIQVGGQVVKPGVYQLGPGSRVKDAIALAGGLAPGADGESINQAARLVDGTQILVLPIQPSQPPRSSDSQPGPSIYQPYDINTADQAALESLPGIGPAKAQAIIQYRKDHGSFASLDDLLNVPGIGPSILDKIRPYLIVTPLN